MGLLRVPLQLALECVPAMLVSVSFYSPLQNSQLALVVVSHRKSILPGQDTKVRHFVRMVIALAPTPMRLPISACESPSSGACALVCLFQIRLRTTIWVSGVLSRGLVPQPIPNQVT